MMQATKMIEQRSPQWQRLDQYCAQLETNSSAKKLGARNRVEFASLYRSACADLALADAYQLPADTVRYLHHLVGRAHNQLYRVDTAIDSGWRDRIFKTTPRILFRDPYVRLAAAVFWLPFLAAMFLSSAYSPVPEFAEQAAGREQLLSMEVMHSEPFADRGRADGFMAGFYLKHNTTIGLQCFAWGLVFGVLGIFVTLSNAVQLGSVFGHMTTVENNDLFFEFVTAHGPFELTAIVLAAGAGMKMGFALVDSRGLRRVDSLMLSARDALPILATSVALFVGAAFIEGFISPSTLPYEVKAMVGMLSTLGLLWYFVVLGFTQQEDAAKPAPAVPASTSPFDT
ncbi:MAG: stage II sporulation protein M [Planctomycetota bacterium]